MDGMRELQANLERLISVVPKQMERAVRAVALDVQGRATEKAPVDTGHLRESASTTVVKTETNITATIGFNATTPDGKFSYALIQHERLDFNHPKGGEPKYLEKALGEVAGDMQNRLQDGLNNFLRGGGKP